MNDMSPSYRQTSLLAKRFFYIFIIVHSMLWILGPALTRASLPHDSLESITWGLQWQLGYNKHPFLAAWLSAGFSQWFQNPDWSIYILAQLAVLVSFISVWRLAASILPETQAIVASLLLDGITFYNINSFNFTPDTLQTPLWALLAWFAYKALHKNKGSFWCLAGLFAGLNILNKYQSGLLIITILLFSLLNKEARQAYRHYGIYLAIFVCFITISPHLIWLWQHNFVSIQYALESSQPTQNSLSHLIQPIRFFISCFLSVAGLLIISWPFYKAKTSRFALTYFQWQYLLFIACLPFLISLFLNVLSGAHFPPRWATPYFSFSGILMMAYLMPEIQLKTLKQFLWTLSIFSFSLWIGRMSSFTVLQRANSDAWLPNKEIADCLNHLWKQHTHKPLAYVAGSHYLIANLVPYMETKPVPYFNFDSLESPWIDLEKLKSQGALFLWDVDNNYVWDQSKSRYSFNGQDILKAYPEMKTIGMLSFDRVGQSHKKIRVYVGLLAPKL